MITILSLNDILNNLPDILQYLVPGACCVVLFCYANSIQLSSKYKLVLSCIISYVLLSFVSLIRMNKFYSFPDTPILNSGMAVILGLLFTLLLSILVQRKCFNRIMINLFHKTINQSIWRDVLDLENGSNLRLYLKDKNYYIVGHLKNFEEKGNDSWIALSAFSKRNKEDKSLLENEPNYSDNSNYIITVRLSDVEYIEIY